MMDNTDNSRAVAARIIEKVVYDGQQLNRAMDRMMTGQTEKQRPFVSEIVNGVVRWFWRLDCYAEKLLERPLRSSDRDVYCLLLVGLYQLEFMRVPQYDSVSESVKAATVLGKSWAIGLVNAILRKYSRERNSYKIEELPDSSRYSHPNWMIEQLREEWPEYWCSILQANNTKPQLTLRVNREMTSVAEYLELLSRDGIVAIADSVAPFGIQLEERIPIAKLPGFNDGMISIQNSASQLVVPAMDIQPGHRVLDACAAPGGKMIHMLETQPDLYELVAVDISETRCSEIVDNLERVGKSATVMTTDAGQPDQWWDQKPFDRILLDAPCTAMGVINKHPDIKHHRRREDIDNAVRQQCQLLDALLPLLHEDGKLFYTTCSILSAENEDAILGATIRNPNFRSEILPASLGRSTGHGRQRLQGVDRSDGFFYASLTRR